MKVKTPLLVRILAAFPVCACMVILGLPSNGHEQAIAFRTLFFVACLVWLIPLTLLQRAMWRREWPWMKMALVHRFSIVRLDMIAELRLLTDREALLRLREGSVLRASRTYMPALAAALQ